MKKTQMLSNEELSSFCMELAIFIHAGIDTGEGMHLLAEESAGSMTGLFEGMAREIEDGAFLSEAMKSTKKFPSYVTGLVAMGEQSGCLEESLKALASYYEQRARGDRQIRAALLYPSLLLLLLLAVIAVLLVRVLPVFQKVYASLGGQFTGIAGGLVTFGEALNKIMPLLVLLLVFLAVLLGAFATSEVFRGKVMGAWQEYHGDKGISRKLMEAHLAQAIAMGLHSGLHMEETLHLAEELLTRSGGAVLRCRNCRALLEEGKPFADALKESQLLPIGACHLLAMGLRSGTGDEVMEEIVRRLTQESEDALERKISRIEPAIVLTASGIVGVILLSVMLPLMNIMQAIG